MRAETRGAGPGAGQALFWAMLLPAAGCNALLGNEPGYLLTDAQISNTSVDAGAGGSQAPGVGEAGMDAATAGSGAGGGHGAPDASSGGSGTHGTGTSGGGATPTEGQAAADAGDSSGATSSDCAAGSTACAPEETEPACTSMECVPGTQATRTTACACGGDGEQVRRCSDSCEWGGWQDVTACGIGCCSQVVFCNTQHNAAAAAEYPGRGTWCRQNNPKCTQAEVRADCEADVNLPEVCDGRIVEEFVIEYD